MIEWHQLIGVLGMLLVVGSYLFLQLGRLASDEILFSILNATGAIFLILSLVYEFNLGAMVVECFWALISILGIVKCLTRKPTDNKPTDNKPTDNKPTDNKPTDNKLAKE